MSCVDFFFSKKGMRPPLSAASTGARSQLHSSTITGGYVQQVPYSKDDTQTRHSQLGQYFILATQLYTYTVYIELYMIHSLSIHQQGMSHHIHTTTTVRTPSSFLLVLLINQHTINHHTLATLHQDTNTHLSMFPTMDTHQLTVHIIPASHHTSTLDLEYKDQVRQSVLTTYKIES